MIPEAPETSFPVERMVINGVRYDVKTHTLITVPELKDENVYIAFRPTAFSLSNCFEGCDMLKSIPGNLFDRCTGAGHFGWVFKKCTSLTSIPANIFDNNRHGVLFFDAFDGCTSLAGESPYTMIGDKKVHLYERNKHKELFSTVISGVGCFRNCTGLSDYNNIHSNWK